MQADATGPDVIGGAPANCAVAVGRESPIVLRFGEPLDPARVNAASITPGGVPLSLALDGATPTMTPTTPLTRLTDDTLIVREGIIDLQGNPMSALFRTDFRAGPWRFAVPVTPMDDAAPASRQWAMSTATGTPIRSSAE